MLPLYVDGELKSADTLAVEAHLMDCAPCRERYESLMTVVASVRAAHPLYVAPGNSYEKAAGQVRRRLAVQGAIAAAILLGAAALGTRISPADPFPAFAAEMHLRKTRGDVPLDVRSNDPQAVQHWLEHRLPFHVALPDAPDRDYSLTGARLVQYREEEAAYIAYEVSGRPVSLLITSSAHNQPHGGATQRICRLTFHSTSYGGLSAVSWVDKGLTYALISGGVGSSARVVCHGGPSERQGFAPLKPLI
jgi:anti-sigma factor RsiW